MKKQKALSYKPLLQDHHAKMHCAHLSDVVPTLWLLPLGACSNKFNYWSKSFSKILTFKSRIPKNNKTSFVLFDGSIGFKFDAIDPFTTKNSFVEKKSSNMPSAIFIKGINFILHGSALFSMFDYFRKPNGF